MHRVPGKLKVLVVGGGKGRVLNLVMPEVVNALGDQLEVRHEVGAGSMGKNHRTLCCGCRCVQLLEFIDNMASPIAGRML